MSVPDSLRKHPKAVVPKRSLMLWLLPASAVAAALLLFTAVPPGREEMTRKGPTPKLRVYRLRNGAATILNAASEVHPGDKLQLAYISAGATYGAVVSLDGGGSAALQFPEAGDEAQTLEAKGEVPLPRALQLDTAPSFERFVLITGNAPFSTAAVLAAAQAAAGLPGSSTAPLSLPGGLTQTSVVLQKTAP